MTGYDQAKNKISCNENQMLLNQDGFNCNNLHNTMGSTVLRSNYRSLCDVICQGLWLEIFGACLENVRITIILSTLSIIILREKKIDHTTVKACVT